MYFEGSEKKIELIVNAKHKSLRHVDVSFWHDMVSASNAEILSHIQNNFCDAYLLSESSLFVWADRIIMITCGNTQLVNSVRFFIDHVGEDNLAFVSYQRKNEYFSHLQQSTFVDDVKALRANVAGTAFRVGHLDSHHHYFFCSDKAYLASKNDCTTELLMYHITGEVSQYLVSAEQNIQTIKQLLELDSLFEGFIVDAHLFKPLGFSINGLRGTEYFTIHITPQENSSYVSVETNIKLDDYPINIIGRLLAILQPTTWDVIGFNSEISRQSFPEHFCLGHSLFTTNQGYNISFSYFQQHREEVLIPEIM